MTTHRIQVARFHATSRTELDGLKAANTLADIRYKPHQGAKEIARRKAKMEKQESAK